jgi:hypothetical protein
MTRIPNNGKGNSVCLSLSASSDLLSTLQSLGLGTAGTVRTGKTRRGENEKKRPKKALKPYEEPLDENILIDPQPFDPQIQQKADLIEELT